MLYLFFHRISINQLCDSSQKGFNDFIIILRKYKKNLVIILAVSVLFNWIGIIIKIILKQIENLFNIESIKYVAPQRNERAPIPTN